MEKLDFEKLAADIVKDADGNLVKRLDPVVSQLADANEQIKTLQEQVKRTEDTLDDFRKVVKAVREQSFTAGGNYRGGWANEKQAAAFGHFVMATAAKVPNVKSLEYLRNTGIDIDAARAKAMAEGVTSTGGALVPEEFINQLIVLIESYGVARRFARNIPIGSASAVWPKLNADVTVYAPGEGGTITASNPTLSNVKVVPTKLAALVAISSELAEDSAVAIGELVGQSIARAFAKAEDQATFLGDGSSTYWGMVGLTGAFQSLASYSSQSANVLLGGLLTATGNAMSEVVIGDFTKMVGALPTYTQDVAWYCSRQFQWATMMRLALAAGGVTAAEYERSAGQSFLSYPVRTVDVMPKTDANSQIGCFFGDLSQGVYLGVRRSMAIEQDASVYFATDQLAIRGTERVGVNAFGFGSTTAAGPVLAMISLAS